MPLVDDGIYKIISVKFSPPNVENGAEQVADLINGGPGPIDGRPDYQAHNDKVRVVLCKGLRSPVQ